jgi:adenine-specific DNA-methyltransferase
VRDSPSLLSVAMRARRWADQQRLDPLSEDHVPGASAAERRRLAALGGLAAAVAEGHEDEWPAEVRGWAAAAPRPPADLVASVRERFAAGDDPLAAVYERAVTPRNRRRLGTFFTPPILVDHMLDRAQALAGRAPDVVVDPGAGVGAFTVAAARRWPDARVVAVDLNVVTLGMLAARLAHEELAARTELILTDFLPWLSEIPPDDDSVWLYLGNPPFTRTQSLDRVTKDAAAEAAGDLVTSGHATLSTYFAAAILRSLRPQDAACLLLPAAWTYTRSARELRQGLWAQRRRPLELHRWPTTARAFTGPDVTATVVGIGAQSAADQPYRYGRADARDGEIVLVGEQEQEREGACPDPFPGGAGRRTTQPPPATVPLSEVFRVRRGLATGANRFFFIDQDVARTLPEELYRPGLLTLRDIDVAHPLLDRTAWEALVQRGRRCILVDLTPESEQNEAVAAYLAAGRAEELHLRYLCAQRDPWYVLERVAPPELLLAPLMTPTSLQLVRNVVGVVPSNSLYGLYRQSGVRDETAARVEEWLRSDDGRRALRGQGRRLRGGSLKLEPGDLKSLPIPESLLTDPEPGGELADGELAVATP